MQLCHLHNLAGNLVSFVSYRYASCTYHLFEVPVLSSQITRTHSWDVSGTDVSVCGVLFYKRRVTLSWRKRGRFILVWTQMTQVAWARCVALPDTSVWSSLNLSSEFFLFVKWRLQFFLCTIHLEYISVSSKKLPQCCLGLSLNIEGADIKKKKSVFLKEKNVQLLCHFVLYSPHKGFSGDFYATLQGLHTQKILNIMS